METIEDIRDRICQSIKDNPNLFSARAPLFRRMIDLFLNEGKEEDAYKAVNSYLFSSIVGRTTLPQNSFFSFRTFTDYSWEDICNDSISLVHPSKFNDPFDPLIFRWIDFQLNKSDVDERRFYCLLRKAIHGLRLRCFVNSDSIEKINPLMWAHYANSHTGFCVQYQFESDTLIIDSEQESFTCIEEVHYHPLCKVDKSLTMEEALYLKDSIWEYENEYRLVHFSSADDEEKTPGVYIHQHVSPKAIYLGSNCSESNRLKMQILLRNKNVALFQMLFDSEYLGALKAERIE